MQGAGETGAAGSFTHDDHHGVVTGDTPGHLLGRNAIEGGCHHLGRSRWRFEDDDVPRRLDRDDEGIDDPRQRLPRPVVGGSGTEGVMGTILVGPDAVEVPGHRGLGDLEPPLGQQLYQPGLGPDIGVGEQRTNDPAAGGCCRHDYASYAYAHTDRQVTDPLTGGGAAPSASDHNGAVRYDVIVIGSGFGGSVAALRLTEKGYRVGVLEAGRRFSPRDFPQSNWDVRRFFWFPRLGMKGIQRMTLLRNVLVLSGAGVGGGSLVYANVLHEPGEGFYSDPHWSKISDWRRELAPHFERAKVMLGVATAPCETPADRVMQEVAGHFGVAESYGPVPVGVFFGEPGVEVEDPYFGGVGPARTGCIGCGGCMIGCRFGAKNSLDRNYLYLAEQQGAVVHPEHEVIDVEPLPQDGYLVTARPPGTRAEKKQVTFEADEIVFAAGALGTTRLLLELRERGRLDRISDRIGHGVRTNSEALVGATAQGTSIDYSEGVAITSSIQPNAHTRIQPVRYPKGSNVMGLLAVLLTDGGPGAPRQLRFLANAVRHPLAFVRSLSVRRWAERSVILLVMQDLDNSLRVFRKRTWFGSRLTSHQGHGEPNPTYIPEANEAARAAASVMDGVAASAVNEVLLDVPTTAHILGGATIADTSAQGVIDPYHRLFGYRDLHVVDGAAVGSNLGVNPALTITALAERAMAMWPSKNEPDPRPPLGSEYQPIGLIPPGGTGPS